jgi:hypothetical protein
VSAVCQHNSIEGNCRECDLEVDFLVRKPEISVWDLKPLNASQRRDLETLLIAKKEGNRVLEK